MNHHAPIIAVCGSGATEIELYETAKATGYLLAQKKAILLCGGRGGVMKAAAEGAKNAGGLTVGLLPGLRRDEANPFIDIPLATGLGHARNALIACASQGIIALAGGPGTLSEIALSLKMNHPVVGLGAWQEISGVIPADSPEKAVEQVLQSIGHRST